MRYGRDICAWSAVNKEISPLADEIHTGCAAVERTGSLGWDVPNHSDFHRNHMTSTGAASPTTDLALRGDPTRWNPEELLLASIFGALQVLVAWSLRKAGLLGQPPRRS
jgi:hypothetical protein